MQIFKLEHLNFESSELARLLSGKRTVIALGNFDGVHLAHCQILENAVQHARQTESISAVFTFLQSKTPFITTFEERIELFRAAGIEMVFAADFAVFQKQAPKDFIIQTLQERLFAAGVSCGFNFHFGYMASGDTALLQTLCRQNSMTCLIADPVLSDGIPISSTEIRRLVLTGDMEKARQMLGRPYALSGTVLHGRAVGRKMNCPTMNLSVEPGRLLPPFGVYFTNCKIGAFTYPAVTNIGTRPTFGLEEISCESFLLSASGNFYDQNLQVELLHFRRPEQKWANTDELKEAIQADSAAANAYFHLI